MTGRPAGWCPAGEVQRAITRALTPAPADDGIPIIEDVDQDRTAVAPVQQLEQLRVEATPPPRARTPIPPPPPALPPPTGSATLPGYEQALMDVAAVLLEDIQMPPQVVGMYLEMARQRRAARR